RRSGEGLFGFEADALDHRAQAVGALRAEVFVQAKLAQGGFSIDGDNLGRPATGIERQDDGDQPAHDVGIGVADEGDVRIARFIRRAVKPDLADAAGNAMDVVAECFGIGRKVAAKLDDIAVTLFPIVEEGKVVADGVYGRSHQDAYN